MPAASTPWRMTASSDVERALVPLAEQQGLALLAEPHPGRVAPIAQVEREAAQRDDHDRDAREAEEQGAEAGLHFTGR